MLLKPTKYQQFDAASGRLKAHLGAPGGRPDPPATSRCSIKAGRIGQFSFLMLMFFLMIVGIIYVEQGQRRIPIQFAKRVRGRKVMGGQSTYIPLKVNSAGVIPVIFATSILFFPALVATSLPQDNSVTAAIRNWIDVNLANSQGTTWFYIFFLGFGKD